MPLRKQRYNPEDPRDAEELLNYLEELSSDDEDYDNIENCNELQFVLFPPKDGADSDIDDAPIDGEEMCSLRDIGKGILRHTMEVVSVSKTNEKNEVVLNQKNQNDDTDEEDDIPLATFFRSELVEQKVKKNIKKRQWKDKNLE
ncbi:hypothetical protein FQA39_LY10202 [Lamprigera yunnana]|nr:hypothetical protein FQA39_LY10202 [Lamprigera yunnana]